MSYDPNKTYFPRGEIIRQFAHAFVEGNARTCGFEREFYMLQAAISGEPEFGKDNRWAAEDRPKKLAKLIRDHLGSIPEADTIRKILKDAIPAIRRIRSPCCARAARGHAAVPPSSVMNLRRLIGFSSSFSPPEGRHPPGLWSMASLSRAASSYVGAALTLFILYTNVMTPPTKQRPSRPPT